MIERAKMPASLVPVILCGSGANLYPICDGSVSLQGEGGATASGSGPEQQQQGSASAVATAAVDAVGISSPALNKGTASSSAPLPKALVPLANRPLIAYALQNILSAGFGHAIVLVPSSQHAAIARSLSSIRLITPPVPASMEGKKKKEENNSSGTSSAQNSAGSSNIFVWEGLAKAKAPTGQAVDNAAIRVELLPLGPYDGPLAQATTSAGEDSGKEDPSSSSSKGKRPFPRTAAPGTAELLRWLDTIGRLEADPLVLPIDLLSPSLPLRSLIDAYVTAQASAQGVPTLCCALYERGAGEGTGKEREKDGPPRLLAGYVPTSSSTTAGQSLVLLEDEPDATLDVSLRHSLLARHPHLRLSTGLLDAHAYIFNRRQVLPLLEARRELTSLREHVVPLLAKASWMKGLAEKAGIGGALTGEEDDVDDSHDNEEQRQASEASELLRREAIRRSTMLSSTVKGGKESQVRCFAVVTKLGARASSATPTGESSAASNGTGAADVDPETGLPFFVARSNTIPTFLECNRWLLKALSSTAAPATSSYVIPQVLVNASTEDKSASALPTSSSDTAQISPDSLIGAHARLLDRASIKRSVVGARVEVGRNARISSCVLMEGCTIGEGAKLENVIVCNGANVGARCNLRDCDVGAGVVVLPDTAAKNEKFVLEEDEDDEDEEDEEDEEDDGEGEGEEDESD